MRRPLYLLALSVVIVLVLAPAALAQTEGLNCEHFANQETAQAILDAHGDLHGHDVDGDGVACEDSGSGTAEDRDPRAVRAVRAVPVLRRYGGIGRHRRSFALDPGRGGNAGAGSVHRGALPRRAARFEGGRLRGRAADGYRPPGSEREAVGRRRGAVALAALLAILVGAGVVGPTREASAQPANPLYLTTSVHPSPTGRIPKGTRMDLLITEQNVTAGGRSARNVHVTAELPAGVRYVAANSSQGQCALTGTAPSTVECIFDTIAPGGVTHINIVVDASRRGTFTNYVYDSLGNAASAQFTIVRRR
jgi:hypothetical protein